MAVVGAGGEHSRQTFWQTGDLIHNTRIDAGLRALAVRDGGDLH